MLDREKLYKEYVDCIKRYDACKNNSTEDKKEKYKTKQILEELSIFAEIQVTNKKTVEWLQDKIINMENEADYIEVEKLVKKAANQYMISFQDFGQLMLTVGYCIGTDMVYKKELQEKLRKADLQKL